MGPSRPAAAAHGGRAAAVGGGGGRPALQLNLVPYVIGTFFKQNETHLFRTPTYIVWYSEELFDVLCSPYNFSSVLFVLLLSRDNILI